MNLWPPAQLGALMSNDFEAIFDVLDAHAVRYVVIGGIAAVLFGSPYPTKDLDICPDAEPSNLANLAGALEDLEATKWDPHKGEFVERIWNEESLQVDSTWLLGTRLGRLDVLFTPAGTQGFSDLKKRRVVMDVAGKSVPVTGLEDLIRMKEAAGRERDLQQVPTLRKLLEEWLNRESRS